MATLARLLTTLLRRSPPGGEPPTDAELLARFARARDTAAFELLVWRHGAMVLGVCRRMLRHEQSAEDAFQAVFLILARKAGRVRSALAGWLHTTARRVCLRMAKRKPFAALEAEPPAAVPPDAAESGERAAVLDAEIARLPEKFRLAVILCYLRGLSTEQAAEQLGIPKGTVLSRLATARKRLAERLTARGVTVPAVFLATVVTTDDLAAEACRMVTTAASQFVTNTLPVSVPSQLATEVLSMSTHKLTLAVVAVVAVSGVGTGIGWVLADGEMPGETPRPTAKVQPAKPEPKATSGDLGPDHPDVKQRKELLLQLTDRIIVEEKRIADLHAQANKVGMPSAARTRLSEELLIDLSKKVLDAQIAKAGAEVELIEAEAAYQKVRGKAEERLRLAAEVQAMTEKTGVAAVQEKEAADALAKLNALGERKQVLDEARATHIKASRMKLELDAALQARKVALEAVTAAAAEADAKRQQSERAKSNLVLWRTKLELLQAKIEQLEIEERKRADQQQRIANVLAEIDHREQQLRKLRTLLFDLEVAPVGMARPAKPEDMFDRILKELTELRREVKELREWKK